MPTNKVQSNGVNIGSNTFNTPGINPNVNIGSATSIPSLTGTIANPNNIGSFVNNLFTGGSNFNQKSLKQDQLNDRLNVLNNQITNDSASGAVDPHLIKERNDLQDRLDLEFGRDV